MSVPNTRFCGGKLTEALIHALFTQTHAEQALNKLAGELYLIDKSLVLHFKDLNKRYAK